MRPEVQVLPGPLPNLTSRKCRSSRPAPDGRDGCRIKNAYLITTPLIPFGHTPADLLSAPQAERGGATLRALLPLELEGGPTAWLALCGQEQQGGGQQQNCRQG